MPTNHILRFGNFEADLQAGELRRGGLKVKLSGQPFEVLVTLLEKPGQLVTREELHQKLWAQDTFVDFEHGLNKAINKVRDALGDDADNPRFIETLPRRGYRFLHPLTAPATSEPPFPVAERVAPPQPVPTLGPVGTEVAPPKASPRKRWIVRLGLAGLCAFIALVYWHEHGSSPRSPRVLRYKQLTFDRQMKGETPCGATNITVTDGPRVLFAEPTSSVADVSSGGGDVVPVPTPFPCFAFTDISPDKTELLGTAIASNAFDQPFWSVSIASGQAHRIGNLVAGPGAWSPDGQKIAYAMRADSGSSDVYVAERDGSNPKKLARIEKDFVGLIRWSPDGKVLRMIVGSLYSSAAWEVSSDGTNLHRMDLFSGEHRPILDMNWTPDGKYFLFTAGRGSLFNPFFSVGGDIWALREAKSAFLSKTAKPTQLTTGALSFWSPTPSPDGKQVFATGGQVRGELVRYDLKSRKLEPYLSGISAEQLDFSRDGKWVAYVTFPEGILWRSRLDGTERLQLTSPPLVAGLPRWSPDGTRIAFAALPPEGIWNISVVSAEGGRPEVVSQEGNAELDPTWSQDGNSLVFAGMSQAPHPRISSVDLRTARTSIVPGSEGMYSPRVSPDGRFIVALEARGDRKLYLFDGETQKWSELMSTKNPGPGWEQWSTDSKFLYYTDLSDRHAPVFYRIRIADRQIERVAAFEVPGGVTGYWLGWTGVAPDGSPLLLSDLSIQEIYALDVDLP
jgi:Tol biopolymer transport system component/DNA-binding winged helix-turn-helix (wHTH) protein